MGSHEGLGGLLHNGQNGGGAIDDNLGGSLNGCGGQGSKKGGTEDGHAKNFTERHKNSFIVPPRHPFPDIG